MGETEGENGEVVNSANKTLERFNQAMNYQKQFMNEIEKIPGEDYVMNQIK